MAADAAQCQKEFLLLGMGNPLLDLQITTNGTQLHEKYGLDENGADLINAENSERLLPIFDDISALEGKVTFVPGGSAQNTMRVCQWMIKGLGGNPKSCCYFGAIGADRYGETLRKTAQEADIEVRYQEIASEKSGTCAVLINGAKRSLVAHLGAAEHFTASHLDDPSNKQLIEQVKIFYVEGYFLTVSVEAILKLATNAAASPAKHFAMNLSANYICEFFGNQLNEVLPYIDILFGNEQEAAAYAKANNFGEEEQNNIGKIALRIASHKKINEGKKRIVVITQGPLPVAVAHDGIVEEFAIEQIAEDKIVDTNGAGDAFCGGFLAALSAGFPLNKCVLAGNFAARTVIQHLGCTFPKNCNYNME